MGRLRRAIHWFNLFCNYFLRCLVGLTPWPWQRYFELKNEIEDKKRRLKVIGELEKKNG